MKTYKKTIEAPRLEIVRSDAQSPREDENLGYFITIEKRRCSPDQEENLISLVQSAGEESGSQEEHVNNIKERMSDTYGKILAIYPVTRYEHSGVSYSIGTVHGFDSSNCGFYIVTDKTAGNEKPKDFERIIRAELEMYNKWVNGEVYAYTLYKKDGEMIDSCGGFYDVEDIRESLPKEWSKEDLSQYIK